MQQRLNVSKFHITTIVTKMVMIISIIAVLKCDDIFQKVLIYIEIHK